MNGFRAMRQARGLSRKAAAQAIGISASTLSKLETGKSRYPQDTNLFRMAQVYQCKTQDLAPDMDLKKTKFLFDRIQSGLTRREAAQRTKINYSHLFDIEMGDSIPTPDEVCKMGKIYNSKPEPTIPSRRRTSPLTIQERNDIVESSLYLAEWVIWKRGSLVRASGADKEDVLQDLTVRMIQAVDTYRAEKGSSLKSHIARALLFEVITSTNRAAARGVKHAPRDKRLEFFSLEAMIEAGFQFEEGEIEEYGA